MKVRWPRPGGVVSARTVGAVRILRRRAETARAIAATADPDSQFAASLRGKACGYSEAADLIERLERGLSLNNKHDKRARHRT